MQPPSRQRGGAGPGGRRPEGPAPGRALCGQGQAAGLRLPPGLGAAVPSAARRDSGLSAALLRNQVGKERIRIKRPQSRRGCWRRIEPNNVLYAVLRLVPSRKKAPGRQPYHAFFRRRRAAGPGRTALLIAGWTACAFSTGRPRSPQLYKTTCLVKFGDGGPAGYWASLGDAISRSPLGGTGGGRSPLPPLCQPPVGRARPAKGGGWGSFSPIPQNGGRSLFPRKWGEGGLLDNRTLCRHRLQC